MKYVWAYIATGLAFLAIDLVWLGIVARDFYHGHYGEILARPFNMTGAVIFAVAPALQKRSLLHAVTYGGLLGFFCYATYNFTALAVIKDFPAAAIPVDLAWGTVLTGGTAAGGYLLTALFFKRPA